MTQRTVKTQSSEMTSAIFGAFDKNIEKISKRLGVKISNKRDDTNDGDNIFISAEDPVSVERAVKIIEYFKKLTDGSEMIAEQAVDYVIDTVCEDRDSDLFSMSENAVCLTMRGKPVKPKTAGQKRYIELIRSNTVVFGVGPAGTGKTFLAVAMAVDALKNKQVNRIILTRPAVEAGERLGFLPGDLQSKIDPYLRPLNDALYEMLGAENYQRHVEKNTIEIAPLAYMRGRTLDDSFIILDEAQNTTPEQMKMFLTRLGYNSKAVVTGDPSQTDLSFGKKSGLSVALKILSDIDDIAIHHFSERDVVRHRLVQKIIKAYDKYDSERAKANDSGKERYRIKKQNG